MIVVKSKMKRKKEKPMKNDQIDNVVDRWGFFCFNWAFPIRYTHPLLTLFDTYLLPNLKQKNSFNQSLKNIRLCRVNVEKHGTFYLS